MLRAYKYRISPTDKQVVLLNKHIGSVRFIYNLALETKQTAYASKQVNLSRYDLQAQLKELKTECTWLKEVNSQSLAVALMHLDGAYSRFFKGQNSFPKFKKKSEIVTKVHEYNNACDLANGFITGFDAAMELQLPVRFMEWYFELDATVRYYMTYMVLYTYWLQNIYQP